MNAKKLGLNKKTFRQAASFKRHAAKYSTHETILIICEGETEVNYLNALKRAIRLPSLTVEVCKTGSAPMNVVEYAISIAEENEAIDQIYCVFDRDQHSTYLQAIEKLRNYKASLKAKSRSTFTAITSVPCFEIWPLLHFNYTARPYTQKGKISPCEQVQKELRKYLPEYAKSSVIWFPGLHENVSVAITNAKKLKNENETTGSENPATDMHELVGYLMKIKGD